MNDPSPSSQPASLVPTPPPALRAQGGPPASHEDFIDFPELARTFNRYRNGVLGLVVLSTLCGALYAFSVKPTYRAVGTLFIEPKVQRVVPVPEVYNEDTGSNEYFGSQFEILRSRELATKLVDDLKLLDSPEFKTADPPKAKLIDFRAWLPFLPDDPEAFMSAEEKAERFRQRVIDQVQKRTTVEPIYRTDMTRIYFEAHDPVLAAQAVNKLSQLFIDDAMQARLDQIKHASGWLTDRLAEISDQLKKSEQALQQFRDREKLVKVGVTGSERTILEDALVDLTRRQRDAEKKRTELASTYAQIQRAGSDPEALKNVSTLLIDPFVQKASSSYLEAQEAYKQLEQRYGAKHPSMQTAQARLDNARTAFYEQLRVAAQGIKAEYEIAAQNEKGLNADVGQAHGELQRIDRKEYEIGVLQRDVDTNRQLYDMFLQRFKQADTTESYDADKARVVDPAIPPIAPFEPRKGFICLVAALVGLVLGIALSLLRHLLSETLTTAEEVESLTGMPVFGVLPKVGGSDAKLAASVVEHPRTGYAEGVRSIQAALRLSTLNKPWKKIMITSSVPKEGKSTVAMALAMAMARSERVLLLEADLRLPSFAKTLKLKGKPGLTELLSGQASFEDCTRKHDSSGVVILPSGTLPPNASEFLASEAFGRMLDQVAERFDRVIIDCPPCLAGSDCMVLSRLADAVLFVIHSDSTSRRAVKNAIKMLRHVQAPLLGTVINLVDVRKNPHYYDSYYYAYGYYGR